MRCSALALAVVACSAPATLSELRLAEQRERAGDIEGAAAAYRDAQTKCRRLQPQRRAQAACAEAFLGEGEVFEHAERWSEAIAVYLAIPTRLVEGEDPATASIAIYRAGQLQLRTNQIVPAWTSLWKVVTDYPDEAAAADALRALLTDGRTRDPKAMAEQMAKLLSPLAETGVADNLVWSLADLTEHELAEPKAARALYDRIPVDHPLSGLRDDARWHAARLSKQLGDPQGAVDRLRALLRTREVAIGAGSYFSVWLDDAQLELGKILRDELHDLPQAAAAFRKLPSDYPASILRDDALWELAVTLAQAADRPGECAAIAGIAKFADSKYAERGAARARELACPR